MKKVLLIISLIVVIVLIFGSYLLYQSEQLAKHTCSFDNKTFDIRCSNELRINIGTEKIITNQTMGQNSSVTCIYGGDCYYEIPVYSASNVANLMNISKAYLGDYFKESMILSTGASYMYRRIIYVKDKDTGEVFSFFLKESGVYNVEKNTGPLDFNINLCKTGGNSELCMPNKHWRCGQGWESGDGCDEVVDMIIEKNLSTDICYKLDYEYPVAYCLGYTDRQKCFSYAIDHPKAKKMCETIQCQQKKEKGIILDCMSLYYYGSSLADCDVYYVYEDFKKSCDSYTSYYNTTEKCQTGFNIAKQRCIDYHTQQNSS